MSTRHELEADLHDRCDPETLAVYADLLQAEGDPRGELIALDLHASGGARTQQRRGALLQAWLGDEVAVAWDASTQSWYAGELGTAVATFDRGFADLVVTEAPAATLVLASLLASPVGEVVRRISLRGSTGLLGDALVLIAARQRPWLEHLA
ncbi:MAG: hypothetical protein M3680_21705, partial [Myxococcota bacterium]|nr:hypothetical protein [Myxococcota bacterium]